MPQISQYPSIPTVPPQLRQDRVTGTLGMSFSDSRLDFSTYPNRTVFVNCAGSQSFEAVPAP